MIGFEIRKIFSKTVNRVGLAVLAAVVAVSCYFAVSSIEYVDREGTTRTGIAAVRSLREEKQAWAGMLTEERLRQVIRENDRINREYPYDPEDVVNSDRGYSLGQGFHDIRNLINQGFSSFREYSYWRADSVSEDEVGKLYENRISNLKDWLASDEAKDQFSEQEKAFLIGRYEELETPFYYEPADGWNAVLEYAPSVIMLTVLVLSFFVSGIFSNEFQWKADSIFFSTRHGRDKGTLAKVAAGFLVISGIYWAAVGIYSAVVFGIAGVGGANCLIQTGWGFWKSFYNITYLQAYLLTLAGGYVGALFILSATMLVSAKTHTTVLAVTIPFVIVFLQSFLGGFEELTDVLGVLPDQLLQMNMVIRMFALYEVGGKVMGAAPVLLTVYPILWALLLPLMYRVYRKTEIT